MAMGALTPYVGGGVSLSRDPELMGSRMGALAALGTWYWLNEEMGLRLDARGRAVGHPRDRMGEVSLLFGVRFD
jgi:hypothetical protein